MIILLDNGSKRPAATKALRRLAADLSRCIGEEVHPVSLLHSSKVLPSQIDGRAAQTLEPFLRQQAEQGRRAFVILPLFFGPSRAVEVFVPEIIAAVEADYGQMQVQVAPILCPMPTGEPRLVDILEANALDVIARYALSPSRLILVDHGSPIPEVSAVRRWLATELTQRFKGILPVSEAVMERRQGQQYDFNGELLEDMLAALPLDRMNAGAKTRKCDIVLAMQFLLPGRHAGPEGDVDGIAEAAMKEQPWLNIITSPLVSEHPLLCDILCDRLRSSVN